MEAQKMRIVIDRNQAKLHLYTLKGASEIKRKIGEIQNYDMWKVNLNDLCLFFDFGAVNKAEQLTFLAEKSFARVLKVKPSNQAWCEMTDEL